MDEELRAAAVELLRVMNENGVYDEAHVMHEGDGGVWVNQSKSPELDAAIDRLSAAVREETE